MPPSTNHAAHGRRLGPWAFAAIVVVYLVIIQAGGRIIGEGISTDDAMATTGNLLKTSLVPIALSCAFAITVATWLRWWPQILREGKPVQPWVRIVPIALVVAALLGASWGSFLDQKTSLIVALVVMVLIVGFTEELARSAERAPAAP